VLYARKHTLLLPHRALTDWFCAGLVIAAILTALGSFERTGLVALAVLGLLLWFGSAHKIRYAGVGVLVALIGLSAMSGLWYDRMATITTFRTEDSALVRIGVWLWTLHYAASHPLGGGFDVYLIDSFRVPIQGTGQFLDISARAFHSIYFEILGEQGIVGLAIFAAMIGCLFVTLRQVRQACGAGAEDAWLRDLAKALARSTLVYLAGGAFVGIAFQPLFYYWFAAAICLQHYVARASRAVVPLPAPVDAALARCV